jgi:hypothetical protein
VRVCIASLAILASLASLADQAGEVTGEPRE